jgi:hypothetical protein
MSEEVQNPELTPEMEVNPELNPEMEQEMDQMDPETQARMEEVNRILEAETIEPTVAINIIVNAVQVSFDKDHFNDLDRYLISKALACLKDKVDAGEDFLIKVK